MLSCFFLWLCHSSHLFSNCTIFFRPHAYPINFSSRTESSSNNNTEAHGDGHNNAESNAEAEVPQQISGNLNEKHERRKIQLTRLAFLALILLLASSIPVLHRKIKKRKEPSSSVSTVKDKVIKDSDDTTQTTTTNEIYVNETAKETFPSITNSTTNSPSASSTVTATPTATATTGKPPVRLCITNTKVFQILEYRAYERGEDPSKTLNYIFCPNEVYDIYEFDDLAFLNPAFEKYDFTSGNSFPLTIFRPNINILCGWNGDINNNCTFRGGWSSINIQREVETETISSALNTTAYNITIQGFRFTGSTSGSSIVIRDIAGSLTLKNCHFYVSFLFCCFPFFLTCLNKLFCVSFFISLNLFLFTYLTVNNITYRITLEILLLYGQGQEVILTFP